jgi:hypothetical protein
VTTPAARRTRKPSGLAPWLAVLWLAVLSCLRPASTLAAESLQLETRGRVAPPEVLAGSDGDLLTFLGGLELGSPDPRFGGLSGLLVSPDGSHFEAVSDAGIWFGVRLRHDETGRLSGVTEGLIAPLKNEAGRRPPRKHLMDAESLAVDPQGAPLVAFEHRHRISRYPGAAIRSEGAAVALTPPEGFDGLAANGGIEALVSFADGALLAIAETADERGASPAFLRRGNTWARLTYQQTAGYAPTGATRLPGGDILLLERRFTLLGGLSARLLRLAADDVRPGARLRPEVIARLRFPLPTINLEGIAARRDATGRTLIYLVSDNNFSAFQPSVLLLFALEKASPKARAEIYRSTREKAHGAAEQGGDR